MSVLSLKRVILLAVASIVAVPLLANHPSPRYYPRMAFDEQTGAAVLFGGRGNEDPATGLTHGSDETWTWIRGNWIQLFPAHTPPGRSSHAMVYDSRRGRVLMFGGRKESTAIRTTWGFLDDTWVWQNGDWTQIETATRPPARNFPAIAYDRVRDRVILFGGYRFTADNKTIEPLYDTWEFDGTDWKQVATGTPEADKPLMAYDVARNETVLLGIDETFKTLMYRWDVTSSSWKSVTPEKLPTCVHEGFLTYQSHNQRLATAGGLCSSATAPVEETWEWDGTTWALAATTATSRITSAAVAYDTAGEQIVRYGGASNFGSLQESFTYVLRDFEWIPLGITNVPSPRSLPAFRRDPLNKTIWVHGGLSEFSYGASVDYLSDFWRYSDGTWYKVKSTGTPIGCVAPLTAFDTDRNVLVVVCGGNEVGEWDGSAWKSISVEEGPAARRFAGLAYDPTLKKTVLFGGYDNVNFRDDTWTWDGKAWTQVKPKTRPPHRSTMAMWYDPLAKKTILYSGVGRRDIDERVTRYSDMWSFDGSTWTAMNVAQTPGIRFGSQYAVDPRDGKLVLFGGLRSTVDEKKNVSQFYGNDTWIWDGAASRWTEVTPANAPPPRQNGGFDFDDVSGKFLLFGGFSGNLYLSDSWIWDGQNWTPVPNSPVAPRRRGSRS